MSIRSHIIASLCILSTLTPAKSMAEEWIGFGQPGKPSSWALETYPVYSHTSPNVNSISTFTELAYFTETGFTGTHRDQFEFWIGGSVGYAKPNPGTSGWGAAAPNLAIEYYYNVIVPNADPGTANYLTWWTSPILSVTFPNGSDRTSGFGAGANQYSYSFSVNNYVQSGKIGATINPLEISYSARNLNASVISNGGLQRLRGGLSLTVADIAAGYQVTDNLFLGLHHSFSLYSVSASDFQESREGKIGPSFTYSGFAKSGLFISGNLNFDYYTSNNLKHSTTVTASIVKNF